jgi:Flp pilus assembly protein TadG
MLKHRSGEKGSALVELALTLPMLGLIMIGGAELARIAYAAIEVQNAARAGAAYGSSVAQDSTGIKNAAQNEAPNITDLTFPTVTQYCMCQTTNSSSGSITNSPQESCSTATTDFENGSYCETSATNDVTNTIVHYVYVSTQAQISTMFHYPGVPQSFTLNGLSQMRVVAGTGN